MSMIPPVTRLKVMYQILKGIWTNAE